MDYSLIYKQIDSVTENEKRSPCLVQMIVSNILVEFTSHLVLLKNYSKT